MSERLNKLLNMLEKEPDDSFLHYGIALEYVSIKEYSRAEEYFKLLIKKDPDYPPAYMQYAQLLEKLDRTEEAKECYRSGIEAAKKTGDKHAAKEMEEFLDELE